MCWTGKRFFERMPRIALRDIEVYKVLGEDGKSPYQEYQYDFNKETKQVYLKTLKRVNGAIDIYEGYHSYSKKCRFVKSFYDNTTYTYITVFPPKKKENLNTFINGLSYNNNVIYKAIIPKGTIYYQNRDGEYVSEKIIVTDELVKPNGKNYIEK